MSSRLVALFAGVFLFLTSSAAGAGKPSKAAAKRVVKAWLAAVEQEQPTDLTAPSFTLFLASDSSVESMDGSPSRLWYCNSATGGDPALLAQAIACAQGHLFESFLPSRKVRPWSKKWIKHFEATSDEGIAARRALARLAKTATLLVVSAPDRCDTDGTGPVVTVFAVANGDDGVPRLSAVYGQVYEFCGE